MARDHCRSRLPDRDRDGAGWQTLRPALRASSCRQSCPARRRRRDAPDRAPRRSRLSLLPNNRKCSAKPPRRRRYPLSLNYLGVRTVEDVFGVHQRGARDFFDALVALELLERDSQGRYANRPDCAPYLDRRSPSYLGGRLGHLNSRLYRHWGHLTQALRTGEPQSDLGTGGYAAL